MKQNFDMTPEIASWIIRHAAWEIYRYHQNKDLKMMAFAALRGKSYDGKVVFWGEEVLAKKSRCLDNRA